MPTVDEASAQSRTQLGASLAEGVDAISYNQKVTFTRYILVVLPADGFVFWVNSQILSQSAILNSLKMNGSPLNKSLTILESAPTFDVQGSLHYVTASRQEEDQSSGNNYMIFTAEDEVVGLNDVSPAVMYLATVDGVRYAFSERRSFYRQAGLYHYRGNAVYADMDTQIIDTPAGLDTSNLVVSNSLPVWLGFNGYDPIYPTFGNPILPLYPSFALPRNISPPFASVHIEPAETEAIQASPELLNDSSHYQLTRDRVRITMYGMRNKQALDFVDAVNQFSYDYNYIGIMNTPIIRDEKKTQVELNILAQKKVIEYEVSYYQTRVNDLTRQLILSAFVTYYPQKFSVPHI